ncbi:MAG: NAD(P)H-hydrate epimerase [Planctomycetes bacterium]|nr:NAD(P)H-hydrate epimerase [Planctomycetota bacterium]
MKTWSCIESAAFDLHLQEECGIPAILLMENAGAALARFALACAAESGSDRILVLAGPGNNGGDGLVAARQLARTLPIEVAAPLGLPAAGPDRPAGLALLGAQGVGVPCGGSGACFPLRGRTLILDALFGTGLSRPLEGLAARTVGQINASGRPVLAVDLPSGLDGDRGRVLGTAVRADWTLSFVGLKSGFLIERGPELCGRIQVAGIGVSDEYANAWLVRRRGAGPES